MKKVNNWIERLKWIQNNTNFGPLKQLFNDENRLHCDDGPAYISPTRCISYRNGRKHGIDIDIMGSITYYYDNILIPTKWFLQPDKLTLDMIFNHPNAEVKYVGMFIYGLDRMLKSNRVKIIHKDDAGGGRVLFNIKNVFELPINIIKVINASPEPDGTYKSYFLNVPPDITTCQEAVAWTFRKESSDYHPSIET